MPDQSVSGKPLDMWQGQVTECIDDAAAPRVSVVMAAYNAAAYLPAAMDSILGQSFGDFEFIIVDDGSTDETSAIIRRCADPRVRPVANPGNLGLIASLNRGFELARGEFIARMDADDEALPTRFEEQVGFLDAHPQVGICGTAYETMGDRVERWPVETEPRRLKCQLLFAPGMAHPSVMMRRDLVTRHGLYYDADFRHAEDYELWTRFAEVTELANVPAVLLRYRLHPGSVSHVNSETQRQQADRVRQRLFGKLGISATAREMFIHTTLMRGAPHTGSLDVDEAEAWLDRLLRANERIRYFDPAAMSAMLYELWYKLCRAQGRKGSWYRFIASPVARSMPWPNRVVDTFRLLKARTG